MRMRQRAKWFSLALLLGAALWQAWQAGQSAVRAWSPDKVDQNFVAVWEDRLARLRADIPAEVTFIGYVADWDIPGNRWDAIDQTTEYVLTQYTLAPRIVRRGFVSDWIIGNFTTPDYPAWLDQHLTHYVLEDYGFGIVLIRTGEALP